jgi:hypothetical protein
LLILDSGISCFAFILYVDVAAIITGVSGEREYIRDGRVVKMVLLELSDNRFVTNC